jgi:hypothetical protein
VAGTYTSPPLNQDKTFVQQVIGVLLYYAQAVDYAMLPVFGLLATQQANPMRHTLAKVCQLLNYTATHPDALITYRDSDMVLVAHSDDSHLSEIKAHSCTGRHFSFLKMMFFLHQWRHLNTSTNHQACHVISSRSRT